MTIVLKPHQQEIVDLAPERALIPDGTGTGKTMIGIALADKLCKTCLVVTIKDNVEKWDREIKAHSNGSCVFLVMSKETFKKYVQEPIQLWDGVIWDECHHVAGAKSQLSKTFAKWLKTNDIKYRWLMSATPVTANWMSVYILANHLGHNMNYYKFRRMFFYEMKMGGRSVWKPNPFKEAKLQELVRHLALGRMIRMEDIAVVPDQRTITEYFNLTPEQKTAIENLNDPEHIVRWTKTHQIENGTLKGNEYEPSKTYQCLKNFRIWEIAREHKKVAIFVRYNHQIDYIKDSLRDLKRPFFIINGENKERDITVRAAEAVTEAIVIVNTACSAGYELPSIGTVIFVSLSFSYLDYEQSKGRFLRVNKLKPNTFYHLVTKGGVDEGVYDCIQGKRDFYIELFKK